MDQRRSCANGWRRRPTNTWPPRPRSSAPSRLRSIEKQVLLQTIDQKWREHLLTGWNICARSVGFRGYAQRDPLNEYKTESFASFSIRMLDSLRADVSSKLARIPAADAGTAGGNHPPASGPAGRAAKATGNRRCQRRRRAGPRRCARPAGRGVRRLQPGHMGQPGPQRPLPPAGLAKKFKHCHGRLA